MGTSFMNTLLKACGFGSCTDVSGNLYEYSEGSLTGRKFRVAKRHLKVCGKCVRFLMSYMAVTAIGKTIHPEKLTEEQKQKILEGLNLH